MSSEDEVKARLQLSMNGNEHGRKLRGSQKMDPGSDPIDPYSLRSVGSYEIHIHCREIELIFIIHAFRRAKRFAEIMDPMFFLFCQKIR